MKIERFVLLAGFGILVATVGLLFIAGGIASFRSHWAMALFKGIVYIGFLYELFFDARELLEKPVEDHYYWDVRSIWDMIALNAGAVAAYTVSIQLAHGSVIASAIVGLTAAVLTPAYAAAAYCGSFVGMASAAVFTTYDSLLLSSVLASLIYVAVRPACQGFGGKLGTIAFAATLLSLLIVDGRLSAAPIPDIHSSAALVISAMIGALLTYEISVRWGHGPVIASSLVGLLAGLILPALYGGDEGSRLALMVFAASFAGMSGKERIGGEPPIMMAGALAGLLFIYTMPYAGGAGGKMGTIAFAAVIAISGWSRLVRLVGSRR